MNYTKSKVTPLPLLEMPFLKRREYYSNNRKMIVLLDDSDIQKMILKKANNEKLEDILIERIDSYRILYRF